MAGEYPDSCNQLPQAGRHHSAQGCFLVLRDIVGCSHLQLRRHLTQRLQHLRRDVALPGGRVGAGKQEAEGVGTLPQPRHILHHAQHRNTRLRQQQGDDVRVLLANSHVTSSSPVNTMFSTTPSIEPVCAGDLL